MEKIREGAENKTKTKHYTVYIDNKNDPRPGSRAKYMDKCNRTDGNTIFRARTKML